MEGYPKFNFNLGRKTRNGPAFASFNQLSQDMENACNSCACVVMIMVRALVTLRSLVEVSINAVIIACGHWHCLTCQRLRCAEAPPPLLLLLLVLLMVLELRDQIRAKVFDYYCYHFLLLLLLFLFCCSYYCIYDFQLVLLRPPKAFRAGLRGPHPGCPA